MAVALATHDPQLAAVATVSLSQALRSRGRRRSALEAALVAADRVGAFRAGDDSPVGVSLRGTLLIQAALAAAGGRTNPAHAGRSIRPRSSFGSSVPTAIGLAAIGAAAGLAAVPVARAWAAGFGRAVVEAARVVAEAALGDVTTATARHERLVAGEEWRWLPPEHRAAYLLDVARAYALTGDMRRAGRTLLDAERTAHSEVHDRPVVRKLVTVVAVRRRARRHRPARHHPRRRLTAVVWSR
ncbi:hypothetical protein NKG94_19980 [Micromonospora sp. M12]